MNILLIEPDKLLATTYAKALRGEGYAVRHSANAQEAIFNSDNAAPDLVILELQLVSHSGIEFLYEFRSYPEWQDIPVIILSQVPPTEFLHSQKLLRDELGVADYQYKPHTTLVKLLQAVQKTAQIITPNAPAQAGTQ